MRTQLIEGRAESAAGDCAQTMSGPQSATNSLDIDGDRCVMKSLEDSSAEAARSSVPEADDSDALELPVRRRLKRKVGTLARALLQLCMINCACCSS